MSTKSNASTVGGANGLNSTTTMVAVSTATAPSSGQVLTATNSTSANWAGVGLPTVNIANDTILSNISGGSAPPSANTLEGIITAIIGAGTSGQVLQSQGAGSNPIWATAASSVIQGYLSGFILQNNVGTPNSILNIAHGYGADSTNSVMITGTTFTKSTAGNWSSGSGSNGMGIGLTISSNTWYHVYAIINSGNYDIYFDTSNTGANAPAGTTAFRYIGSVLTDGSAHILKFTQTAQKFLLSQSILNVSGGTGTSPTTFVGSTPRGFVTFPLLLVSFGGTPAPLDNIKIFPGVGATQFEDQIINPASSANLLATLQCTTNTSSQMQYQVFTPSGGTTAFIETLGYINPYVSSIAA